MCQSQGSVQPLEVRLRPEEVGPQILSHNFIHTLCLIYGQQVADIWGESSPTSWLRSSQPKDHKYQNLLAPYMPWVPAPSTQKFPCSTMQLHVFVYRVQKCSTILTY